MTTTPADNTENTENMGKRRVIENYVPDAGRVAAAEERLRNARVQMLLYCPFWGYTACYLELQDASGWCDTAATDGIKFYYNVNFMDELNDENMKFLFAHEVAHCIYDHPSRAAENDYNKKLYNIAADYMINYELTYDVEVGKQPPMVLCDEQYAGDTTDEIYQKLINDPSLTVGYVPCDEHLDIDYSRSGGYVSGDEHNAPKISRDEAWEIAVKFKNQVISTANQMKQAGKFAGSVPAGMERLIGEWTRPSIDWRAYITNIVRSGRGGDNTFTRRHRRGELSGGIILPGKGPVAAVDIHIAVDTSGSMSDETLRDVLGEVVGIAEQFQKFTINIWSFDGDVHPASHKVYNEFNMRTLLKYEPVGGGGTDFMANWDWMKKQGILPTTLLMLTDGYPCGAWGDPHYAHTIFLIHGDPAREIKAPFGVTVHYEETKKV